MPMLGDYTDLRALIPFIVDEVRNKCGRSVYVMRDDSDDIALCICHSYYECCIRLYWYGGSLYLKDERREKKAEVTTYELDKGLKHIASLLCTL